VRREEGTWMAKKRKVRLVKGLKRNAIAKNDERGVSSS
jgi:hypothetical protein